MYNHPGRVVLLCELDGRRLRTPQRGHGSHRAGAAPAEGSAGRHSPGSNVGKEALAGSPTHELSGFLALPSSGSSWDAGVLQPMEAVGCPGMPLGSPGMPGQE